MGWRIIDWEKFEIKGDMRSPRKFYGGLDYITVPTRYENDKLLMLLRRAVGHYSGLEAFGLFVLLLEIWACSPRSKREGGVIWSWNDNQPATLDELAYKLRLRKSAINRCLELLIKVGWIEKYNVNTAEIQCKCDVNTSLNLSKTNLDKTPLNQDLRKESFSPAPQANPESTKAASDDDMPY